MKFSLVIPAYNEEANIPSVVRGMREALCEFETSFEIIVVDNGSTDRIPEILRQLATDVPELRSIRIEVNRGYGNGVMVGLREAKGDILGWVDADNQIAPEDVVAAYLAIRDGQADLVKAVRRSRRESLFRGIQSVVYNALFRLLFGGSLRDINAKPKLFVRSFWESSHLVSLDWFIDAEVMIKAMRKGSRIAEVEVSWGARTSGRSNIRLSASIEFLKNMFRYKFLGD